MDEFEIARNITIGQYLALNSFVHRMDPRFKLLCFIALIGAITYSAAISANLIMLLLILAFLWFSKIPIHYALDGLKPAVPFLVVLAILQVLFYTSSFAGQNCTSFLSWGPVDVNSCGIRLAAISSARFVELLVLTSLLTFSTTVTELTLGTEQLLSPLQRRLNFPAHELALTMTVALRFVPIFVEELERIVKAQVSRGADLGQRGRLRFVQQTRAILPLVVPLFLSALRRAEELILAMEARCYVGGKGRTRFLELKTRSSDLVAFAFVLGVTICFLVFPFPF